MSIIQLSKMCKMYGKKTIFNDFSLDICEGDFVAFMGPSGCGKSTLLNIIGLIEDFDEGELTIVGQVNVKPNSLKANKILRNNISYLFQNFALVEEETVEYNLKMALKYVKATRKQKNLKIVEVLNTVGLENFQRRPIYELSGGEQQRVAIARIMLKPCNIVLADEPTGSLDEHNRDLILNLIKKLNTEGKTVILVTHDKYVAEQCHKIIHL